MGRPRTPSIQHKLAGLSFGLLAAIVVALTAIFASGLDRTAATALDDRARLYGKMLAHDAEGIVARGDGAAARTLLTGLADDPSIVEATLYGARGEQLAAHGVVAPGAHDVPSLVREGDVLRCVTPLATPAGRGALVVRMSTRALDAARTRTLVLTLLTSFVALVVGLVLSWHIGGSFVRRLRRIRAATRAVTEGHLDGAPLGDTADDEVGALARDFESTREHLRQLVRSLESRAEEEKTHGGRIVAAKTRELRARNEDLRFLLDNVGQGFVTVDEHGLLSAERSAMIAQWFGPAPASLRLWELVGRADGRARDWLEVGWPPLFEGTLPLELALDQLPRELRFADGRVLGVKYRPFFEDGKITRVVLVLSDRTAELARERAEAAQAELATIAGHVVSDPSGVEDLLEEGQALLLQLRDAAQTSLAETRRLLHTLKGNVGFFGLDRLTSLLHVLETHTEETGDVPPPEDLAELEARWAELEAAARPLLGSRRGTLDVTVPELEDALRGLRGGRPREDLADTLESWRLESMQKRLERMAEQAAGVAARLGKKGLVTHVEANGVRLDGERWGAFFGSLVHVVRNAVDHGIEGADERRRAGKPTGGNLVLRTYRRDGAVYLEITDDGRGIDWGQLKAKAHKLGVAYPKDRPSELLFADGLSTRSEITELSGRGVGLAACRQACLDRGGAVEVTSRPGLGTTFRFRLPLREESTPRLRPGARAVPRTEDKRSDAASGMSR